MNLDEEEIRLKCLELVFEKHSPISSKDAISEAATLAKFVLDGDRSCAAPDRSDCTK